MTLRVYLVVQGDGELLERMDVCLYFTRLILEAGCEGDRLSIYSLHCSFNESSFELILRANDTGSRK